MRKEWMWGGVVLAAVLGGCATASDLRNGEPKADLASTKPVADVATCISDAWSVKQVDIRVLPTAGGQSVQIGRPDLGGTPSVMADVLKKDEGAEVKFYTQGGGGTWFLERVKSCI